MSEVKEQTKMCSHCWKQRPMSELKRLKNRYKCIHCIKAVAARDKEIAEERKKLQK